MHQSVIPWEEWTVARVLSPVFDLYQYVSISNNSCGVLLFMCYMSHLIVPMVLMRRDLVVVFLSTNAYPNLGFFPTEQSDKQAVAVLKPIVHSCFSFE